MAGEGRSRRLQSFPVGLVGEWNVAGMTFVADASTEFKQRNGPLKSAAPSRFTSTDAAGVTNRFANRDEICRRG